MNFFPKSHIIWDSECEEENGLYQCKGEQKCIPLEWLCDTRADCPLGDDEQHASCGSSEGFFKCLPWIRYTIRFRSRRL